MKPTLSLSPQLRTALASLVSRLPGHVSLAAGVNPGAGAPYFMDIRVSSSGLTRARERIAFDTEEQVMEALIGLQRKLGLTAAPKVEVRKGGFTDLESQLAVMRITASIAT